MATRGSSRLDRLVGIGLDAPAPDSAAATLLVDSHLHSERDAVCPRCLRWIEERDFVRQTAYGPLQHEVCPLEPTG
jgi:hypothetical protein